MRLIKRTLFNEYSQTKRLNLTTEAIKGIYSAIRLTDVCKLRPNLTFCCANCETVTQVWWLWARRQC